MGGKWDYQGGKLPFPTVIPVNAIPSGGYPNLPAPVHQKIQAFNQIFAQLLQGLEAAWSQGGQKQLQDAIDIMFKLQPAAARILAQPMPDGTYFGPTFDVNDVP